eukprot:TRINITY_DN4785_c0_g2_i2.p1 TRINITY_DN4785_c0_g2~~TRINITY_DN4785_c0_g2_i2.p1  ORF type:complete len:267 (-),score=74.69 TRINITY_DN4785_c0_g2_i2:127-927(-)
MQPDPLAKTKEYLGTLVPTQESVTSIANNFLLLSSRGYTVELSSLWKQTFDLASSEQKLSLLYLLNQIVKTSARDEGRLKRELTGLCEKAFEKAYKLSSDVKIRQEIMDILSYWRESKIYDEELINRIESTLKGSRKESGKMLQEEAKRIDIEPYINIAPSNNLTSLEKNIRNILKWEEKMELTKETLDMILKEEFECSEVEVSCKISEYKKVIEIHKEAGTQAASQLKAMIATEDSQHLRDVLQIKKTNELIQTIQELKDAYLPA